MFLRILFTLAVSMALILSCSDEITNIYYQNTNGAVFGNVVPADSGIAVLNGLATVTTPIDADGYFNFADVPPGTYMLELKPNNHGRRQFRDVVVGTGVTEQFRGVKIAKTPFPIFKTSPDDNETVVYVGTGIYVYSDVGLDVADLNARTSFEPPVSGEWVAVPEYYEYGEIPENVQSIYYYDPDKYLQFSTEFRMTISGETNNLTGVPFDDDLVLHFTTADVHVNIDAHERFETGRVARRSFRATFRFNACTELDIIDNSVRFVPPIEGEWVRGGINNRCDGDKSIEWDFLGKSEPLLARTQYLVIVDLTPLGSPKEDTASFLTEGIGVVQVSPRNGYDNVPRTNQVLVIFNEPMDTISARESFSLEESFDGVLVPGTFAWDTLKTEMMFSHWDDPFDPGFYIVNVCPSAKTALGDTLDTGWESYFIVR